MTTYPTPWSYNTTDGMVAGQWYRAVALGTPFEFWVPRKLTRSELRPCAWEFVDRTVYELDEIESVRAIKRPTSD